jgi:hypothetical protein
MNIQVAYDKKNKLFIAYDIKSNLIVSGINVDDAIKTFNMKLNKRNNK